MRLIKFFNKSFVIFGLTVVLILLSSVIVFAENPPIYKTIHKVAKGESLTIISKKYDCTITDIKKWNKLTSEMIHPGQVIYLTPINENSNYKFSFYKVKSGDCLSSIALKHRCSVDEIKKWNNLKSTKLSLNQKLIVSKVKLKEVSVDSTLAVSKNQIEVKKAIDTLSIKTLMSLSEEQKIDSLISFAHKFLGRPYHSRIENFIFDCSGYVSFLFSKFGVTLPRSSPGQAVLGEEIDLKDLRKGDLVFFNGHKRNKRVGHVGMVISADGNNFTMIHSSTHRGIVVESFRGNPYFEKRYITARRIAIKS